MNTEYPEIKALNDIYVKHKVMIKITREQILDNDKDYPSVDFQLAGKTFKIFVDDEYQDLRYNYPLLNLCLVLRELESFDDSRDYEIWCQERYKDAQNEQVKANHQHLGEIYEEIKQILGNIDSQVSDFDFEMNARAAQRLRKSD